MEFRWVAVIALWTLLSGPVFSPSSGGSSGPAVKGSAAPVKVPTAVRK
jgi:hypothetical protein